MTPPTPLAAELADAAERFAAHLAIPEATPDAPWAAQSLAQGAPGIALVHIERAHAGKGTWRTAHAWIQHAVGDEISAADTTGLFLGAPAIAFMLHTTNVGSATRYTDALATMDAHVAALTHRRTEIAMARIHRGDQPAFREYDVFYGLTGIGAHLLRRDPGGSAFEGVLRYLIALTRPLPRDGQPMPGWWVAHDPHTRTSARFPGGHGNLGAAHGITGPLMLLSQAARRGITVDGQHEAINTISAWLDTWKQDGESGPWWPEVVTVNDLRTGRSSQLGTARPSWCYGTPGITRALQLAALAAGDTSRQREAEQALATCLSDPAQVARLTDASLCHGWGGVYQTTWRAARDATTSTLDAHLPRLAQALARHAKPGAADGPGLLEGDAGTALALITAGSNTAPTAGWDACLLID